MNMLKFNKLKKDMTIYKEIAETHITLHTYKY